MGKGRQGRAGCPGRTRIDETILDCLGPITQEEYAILNGDDSVDWKLYIEQSGNVINAKKLLDSDLMNQIRGGLMRNMTDEEINQFAENLLRPQLNAALEESRQNYETTKLSKEQELENLAASLTRAIDEQNTAYRKSAANVETAALSRGMGRSSYTLQTLAQRDGNPVLVSLLLSLESFFAAVFGAVLLHERLSAREILGCGLMLAAIVLAELPGRRKTA